MKVYISGQISGLDLFDVKKRFLGAEKFLEELGVQSVNPIRNGLPDNAGWITHLCRDIEMLYGCEAIYMMDGWQHSVGACIEYDFAVRTGKVILFESNIVRTNVIVLKIENAIHEVTGLRLNQYNTKSRKRDGFFARMLFAHHCSKENMNPTDIAEHIQRDTSSIQYFLNKYSDEVRYNQSFRAKAERVNEILKK